MDDQSNKNNQQDDVLDEEILNSQIENEVTAECSGDKSAEYLAGWQRALADYKNLQEKSKFQSVLASEMAKSAVFSDIIPIIDNFNVALTHVPDENKNADWVIGLFHVKQQLLDLCKRHGLDVIDETDINFDPNIHEAISYQPSDGEADKVLTIASLGLKLGDRVIRPAKVIVSSNIEN